MTLRPPAGPPGGPPDGRPGLLPARFLATASARPDAVAVEDGGTRTTFAELAGRSAAVAARLLAHGVGAETVVGLCLPRSADFIAAALGVLRAGGAFLPLDPAYPADRLRYLVRDSGTTVVLTGGDDAPRPPEDVFPRT
ncbi:AMP-binding protein [Streptomyces lydicus]|nr:AMP-binding protein [Streptomyces lydicus]